MKYKNGIVFHCVRNFVVAKQGRVFEVSTLLGSDGGPELLKQFDQPDPAVAYANELASRVQ